MSGFWTERCTVSTWTKTIGSDRQVSRTLNTQTTNVPCNFQPTSSGQIITQSQQMGRVDGTLYYDRTYTIDVDDTVTVRGAEYRVLGPAVYAAESQSGWVLLEREVP